MYNSLKSKKDFDRVYKNGKVFGNRYFTFRYIKNDLEYNRFGIVISKRVSTKAVIRNRLRRQIKAKLTQIDPSLKTGYDMIISVKNRCVGTEFKVLGKALNHLFLSCKLKK